MDNAATRPAADDAIIKADGLQAQINKPNTELPSVIPGPIRSGMS